MRALIAARHLMRAARLRKLSDINMLDVCARHRERHIVLRLAGRRAGMATDAARVVNHFGPLSNVALGRVNWEFSH